MIERKSIGGTKANAERGKTNRRLVIMTLLRRDSIADAREISFVRNLGLDWKQNGFPQRGGSNEAQTEGGWF